MADYNVNMKQWNRTSFDNVLPLAYNSKKFDNKTLEQVTQPLLEYADNGVKSIFEIVDYIGTGSKTHTRSFTKGNPDIIVFACDASHSKGPGMYSATVNIGIFTNNVTKNIFSESSSIRTATLSKSGKDITISSTLGYYAFNENKSKYSMIGIWTRRDV